MDLAESDESPEGLGRNRFDSLALPTVDLNDSERTLGGKKLYNSQDVSYSHSQYTPDIKSWI